MKYDISKMKYEYKYFVPLEQLDELREMINPFVYQDSYMDLAGSEGYTVRSIYFDTPGYDYYHEKVDGLKIRKKIRIRGYNTYGPDNIVFLEIKRKNEKRISKNRAPLKFADLGTFIQSDRFEDFILTDFGMKNAIEDSRRFLFHLHRHRLMPTVLVIYEREAFFGKYDNSLRMTFDKNLRGTLHPKLNKLYSEDYIRYSTLNHFIFEVKFYDVYPSWLKRINVALGLKLGAFSKFTTCIEDHTVIQNNSRQMPFDYVRDLQF